MTLYKRPYGIVDSTKCASQKPHVWEEESQSNLISCRESLPSKKNKDYVSKGDLSEWLGEEYGHKYVTEILNYEVIFHPIDKSIRQGLDAIYIDSNGEIVAVEFKGQSSKLTDAQKLPTYPLDVAYKIQLGIYSGYNISDDERRLHMFIIDEFNKNGSIRYEVICTVLDQKKQKFFSQLQKQFYLSLQDQDEQNISTQISEENLQTQSDNRTLAKELESIGDQTPELTSKDQYTERNTVGNPKTGDARKSQVQSKLKFRNSTLAQELTSSNQTIPQTTEEPAATDSAPEPPASSDPTTEEPAAIADTPDQPVPQKSDNSTLATELGGTSQGTPQSTSEDESRESKI